MSPLKQLQALVELIPHWILLVLAGATGALLTYFQQTSTSTLVASLSSWTLLKPILAGAVTVFLTALVTLLKSAPWASSGSSSGGGTMTVARPVTTVPPAAATPPVAKRTSMLDWAVTMIVVGIVGAAVAGTAAICSGCTPAESATWTNVENVVLTDLENGAVLDVIEAGIKQYVPAGADLDAIINEAIQLLHDLGLLPANILPVASSMQAQIAAMPAGSHTVKK